MADAVFLAQAIEDLYVAFSDVPVPQHIVGCPCCGSEDLSPQLLRTGRRLLSGDEFSRYAHKAITTQGSAEDYLYFFPRIVELMITERYWGPNWEVVLGKIGLTDPASWPAARRAGFNDFLLKAIEGSSYYPDDPSNIFVDDLVCGIGRTTLDIGPYLAALLEYPALVVEFYQYNNEYARDGWLRNAFWPSRLTGPDNGAPETAQRKVIAWLHSPEVEDILTCPTVDELGPGQTRR